MHVAIEACSAGCLSLGARARRCRAPGRDRRDARAPGRKRRAKTDRQDALWLRELLAGEAPEARIAPEHIRQWRSRLHLRKR